MDLNKLIEYQGQLKEAIKQEYLDVSRKSEPIYDGLFNYEQYAESTPRILWMLKEPYCDGNDYKGGGWILTDDEKSDEISRWRSFQPMCYINYGIWKGEYDWNKMPWLKDCEEMRIGLKKMALINVSKLPGLKTSPWGRIVAAYQTHREFILRQIKNYEPNVIFACDPHVNLILKDFGFSESQWQWFGSGTKKTAAAIKVSSEQRLVWVRHPCSRTNRATYVNEAILAATASL